MTYKSLREQLRKLAAADFGKNLEGWERRYAKVLAPEFGVSEKEMVTLLKLTKQHHTAHEITTGETDPDWAKWYAVFMLDYMCVSSGETQGFARRRDESTTV